jgi:hypothetical protein
LEVVDPDLADRVLAKKLAEQEARAHRRQATPTITRATPTETQAPVGRNTLVDVCRTGDVARSPFESRTGS